MDYFWALVCQLLVLGLLSSQVVGSNEEIERRPIDLISFICFQNVSEEIIRAYLETLSQRPATVSRPAPQIPDEYEYLKNGSVDGYYKLHTHRATWNNARRHCRLDGAHLAVINAPVEADLLATLIVNGGHGDYAHIGMHDLYAEGSYVTIFDETLSDAGFNEWREGEPDGNKNENCGSLHRSATLADRPCLKEQPFICEIKNGG